MLNKIFDYQEAQVETLYFIPVYSKNGYNLVELSSLGYAANFTKASNNIDINKFYNFLDKSKRELYLACDLMPGILRRLLL